MQPSSTLCRDREAHHHALARTTTLDNVRLVANAAAAAWAKEGVAAGLREDRKLRTRAGRGIAQLSPVDGRYASAAEDFLGMTVEVTVSTTDPAALNSKDAPWNPD